MKYLNDYMQDKQTATFNKFGAFFAFSDTQFNEQKKEGVKYVSMGAGILAPINEAKNLRHELNTVYQQAIKQDIQENGIKAIIHRELANHECQISMDHSDALISLDGYGITEKQVLAEWSEYYQCCLANDCF